MSYLLHGELGLSLDAWRPSAGLVARRDGEVGMGGMGRVWVSRLP